MDWSIIINTLLIFFLLIYWLFAFLILYHLTRFGIGVQPKRFAALFLFGSLSFSFVIFFLYSLIDITGIKMLL